MFLAPLSTSDVPGKGALLRIPVAALRAHVQESREREATLSDAARRRRDREADHERRGLQLRAQEVAARRSAVTRPESHPLVDHRFRMPDELEWEGETEKACVF